MLLFLFFACSTESKVTGTVQDIWSQPIESVNVRMQNVEEPTTTDSSGIFYYQQPRKFLWQYQLPQNQKIVSTGSRMFFHDFETEQTTQIPMSSGFASFLTKQPLRLNDEDFKVLSSEELEGIINITLQLADDSSQQFNLRFESNPIKLLSMTQKGEFGTNLNITFANQKYNKPVDSELFKFTPELEKVPE